MTSLLRYVALGDSTGVGVGASNDGGYPERVYRKLKNAGHPAGILNLAQSGATTADVLQTQAAKAASAKPALITLGIGTNDLWRMVPAAVFETNLQRIADLLGSSGARVVVSTLFDLRRAPIASVIETRLGVPLALIGQRVDVFNRALRGLQARARFEVIDLFDASNQGPHRLGELFSSDGFHPSALGYDRWAELLWPSVERAAEQWHLERRG
ncbi:MAG: SGNH/GDSL hydrolase family protein [Archangium sp.]|nr:SGNH/GDSL hydrolase family protein [Archangium sp.]